MYDKHFGLTDRPFQLTPDPRFWFETATHRKAMTYLGYGLAQGEGFVVITGDIGAGKTTLVAHLLGRIDRARLHVVSIASSAIQPDDLLRIVAGQLDVDPARLSKAELLVAIERGLHAVARSGRRTLLVVDEAQALPVPALEELRMLSNIQAGGHALIQILLLGQPEFRERIQGTERLEQLRQRIVAVHHLEPMEPHEIADYVAHRLSVVGWQGKPDFSEEGFNALYQASGGVPRRVNLLAGRVMLQAAIEGVEMIEASTVAAVAADFSADLPDAFAQPAAPAAPAAATPPQPRIVRTAPAAVRAPAQPASAPPLRPVAVAPTPAAAPTPPASEVVEWPVRRPAPEAPAPAKPAPSTPAPAPAAPAVAAPAAAAPAAAAPPPADAEARIAALEARVEEQERALRRVLTLLVDWAEAEGVRKPEVVRAWGHAA